MSSLQLNGYLISYCTNAFVCPYTQPTKVHVLCGMVDILFVHQGDVGGGRHSHKLTISWWVNGPLLYFLYSFPAVPCRSKLIAGFGQLYPPCRLSPLKAKVISATNPFINLFLLCCRKGFCRPVMKLASVWFSLKKKGNKISSFAFGVLISGEENLHKLMPRAVRRSKTLMWFSNCDTMGNM